jgi:hypothetical protein
VKNRGPQPFEFKKIYYNAGEFSNANGMSMHNSNHARFRCEDGANDVTLLNKAKLEGGGNYCIPCDKHIKLGYKLRSKCFSWTSESKYSDKIKGCSKTKLRVSIKRIRDSIKRSEWCQIQTRFFRENFRQIEVDVKY